MKLATFTHNGSSRVGIVVGDEIVDLAAADASLPKEMTAFLTAGPALGDYMLAACFARSSGMTFRAMLSNFGSCSSRVG